MSNHTPGPWRLAVDRERQDKTRHFVWSDAETPEERDDGSPFCIATINPRKEQDQLDDNAKLICAAPLLAEELKRCVQMLRALAGDIEDGISRSMVHKILQAIDNCEDPARAVLAKAGVL